MVALATGSDTAGSITVPAAFCGLAGLKPSHRRIPIWPGSDDWQTFSDVGPTADCDLFILPATACPAFPLRQLPLVIGARAVMPDWPSHAPFNMLANLPGGDIAGASDQ